jgi:hypothetical protein
MNFREIILLAKEAEKSDPIDWGRFYSNREEAYHIMTSSIFEVLESVEEEDRLKICMASLTKAMVENFLLNMKIMDLCGENKNES